MSNDDPIGKRNFAQAQNPFETLKQMMADMPNLSQMLNSRIRIELDITADEGIQILELLKSMRK
jgi:hypothetical protein